MTIGIITPSHLGMYSYSRNQFIWPRVYHNLECRRFSNHTPPFYSHNPQGGAEQFRRDLCISQAGGADSRLPLSFREGGKVRSSQPHSCYLSKGQCSLEVHRAGSEHLTEVGLGGTNHGD